MAYDIEVRQLEEQPVLSIRQSVPMDGIQDAIGEFLQAVWSRVKAAGQIPAGPPFTRYHAVEDAGVVLEAGLPVSGDLEGEGRIEARVLPGGEAAATDHYGPYEGLPDAGEALEAWARQHDRTPAGPRWEVYWTDPGEVEDPQEWRTEVIMPLEPA